MITGISIENFKGIGKRVDIPIRPITLLFGANSAGKSTVLQAVQYAAHVLAGKPLDVSFVGNELEHADIGGFQNFVHQHDLNRDVNIGVSFGLADSQGSMLRFSGGKHFDDPETLMSDCETAEINVSLRWNRLAGKPYVRRFHISIDGVPFVEIRYQTGRPHAELGLNIDHPAFRIDEEFRVGYLNDDLAAADDSAAARLLRECISIGVLVPLDIVDDVWTHVFGVVLKGDALPDFQSPLRLQTHYDLGPDDEGNEHPETDQLAEQCRCWLSNIVLGPGHYLNTLLKKLLALGPVRQTPDRHFIPTPQRQHERWASGLGAWDLLQTASDSFVERVSEWLGGESGLNCGYTLRIQRFKEIDLSDPLLLKLQTGRAFDEVDVDETFDVSRLPTHTRLLIIPVNSDIELRPSDVGVGISQVIPVIVTAIHGTKALAAIEQPELHLHPRVQAELGDLFINAALGDQNQSFLLETHSEHLILRLLRRIRETNANKNTITPPISPDDITLLYVHTVDGESHYMELRVDKHGRLIDSCPGGFFEEDFKELF